MLIKDVMTVRPVCIGMDISLREIHELFENGSFSHVLVLDDDEKLIGIISDRDVLRLMSPYVNTAAETYRDLNTLSRKAHQIMTRDPFTARLQMTVPEAARFFLEKRVSCLPVIDDRENVVGIVTTRDLLRQLAGEKAHGN
ncbi:MAG TPA: CBS domain-containing protein [Calditrichia bacterium]|nr:CBS domain-containing protein [Calditrichia bacterium]HQV33929.1 CBS domain-containing protein [Calditrichia bacterium]